MRRQLGLFSTPWLMIRWMAGVWFGSPAPLLPGFILKMVSTYRLAYHFRFCQCFERPFAGMNFRRLTISFRSILSLVLCSGSRKRAHHVTEWVTRRHIWLLSPSDILPPNKHIFHASCRAKKDIFLAYCVPALMTWPPLEDADVWCLAEICEWLVSLTPTCLVPFHPLTIYNMSAQLCNLQCPPAQKLSKQTAPTSSNWTQTPL